ncbi:MAG: hypothetical protein H7305_12645 [Gemmatimonadaceae bacterium]|nr:hypothetical protein [Gemmatimonadaceae bacterium]
MSLSSLTAQLPQLPGTMPDLFRRGDSTAIRGEESKSADMAPDASSGDQRALLLARGSDDVALLLARRAALGPLTYGRRSIPADAPAAAPSGMRGVHLDVRG